MNQSSAEANAIRRPPSTPLKIYSDQQFLPEGRPYFPLFYPFWGEPPQNPRDPMTGIYDQYVNGGKQFIEMTPLPVADVAVFPAALEHVLGDPRSEALCQDFASRAVSHGVTPVAFLWSDDHRALDLPSYVLLRTSLMRSKRIESEFAMPAWSEDFYGYLDGDKRFRVKNDVPVVGFCGYSDPLVMPTSLTMRRSLGRLARKVGIQRGSPGLQVRRRALALLSSSSVVSTNFIIRDRFWGSHMDLPDSHAAFEQRREYVSNMFDSDYVLCIRGAGNFSGRLYEALSCGRIPLFVNTDCVLPYDFEIDWRDFCVWVEYDDLKSIHTRLLEFHSSLSETDFIDIQKRCRELWEARISPEGFFRHFYRHFALKD